MMTYLVDPGAVQAILSERYRIRRGHLGGGKSGGVTRDKEGSNYKMELEWVPLTYNEPC